MSPELKLSVFDTTISITDTIKRDRITKKNLGPKEVEGEVAKEGMVKQEQEPPTAAAEIKEEVKGEGEVVTVKEEVAERETKPVLENRAAQQEPSKEEAEQASTNAVDARSEEERQAVAEAYRLFLEDPQDFLRSLQIMFSTEDGPGASA